MGRYTGESYKIVCGIKGIDNNLNINAIKPDSLIWPSKNIDLSKGGWGCRGGTARINGTAVSGAPRIMGIYDFLKIGGSQYIVFATSDGKIYKNSTNTIKTGLGSSKYGHFEMFDNELIFCNGYNKPTKWDGSAGSTTDFVSGEKAVGVITMNAVAAADQTFVIDTQTFTWKVSRANTGEVTLGASASAAVTNIVTAVNLDLTTVVATDGAGNTVNITAETEGEVGGSIVFTEASINMAMNGSGTLSGGVDGELPTDWAGTNYPSVMIRHGRGNSERMWAFGCASNPYTIYVTSNGSGTGFSDTNVTTFSIDTGDDAGIVGGTVYKDRLILFGKRDTFVIDDADTDTANWGYTAFTREGGVAHQRLIIPTPNDVICMMEDGEIYSLAVAEQYGDYKAGSITRPKFMNRWIHDNVRLSYIEHFHGVYDPVKRVVRIFVVRTGQTQIDTAMVYYIDTGEWMIEDNLSYGSGYTASSSALIKVSPGVYEIYTGDYSGFIWHLDQSSKNDNSNVYESRALTPYLYFENPRESKLYHRCWIDIEADDAYELTVKYFINILYATTVEVLGTAAGLGSFVLGYSVLGPGKTGKSSFPIGRTGEKIQFAFKNNTVNKDFFISRIMIDYKTLKYRPMR